MRKLFILLFIAFTCNIFSIQSQTYRGEKEKIFSLIHTKLKVDFNFENQTMNGEEWVTLKPHFYPSNILILDAKAMLIHKVLLNNKDLKYNYKDNLLHINLPRKYTRNEELTIYIKYTAQPEKVNQKGSSAITDAKGLYFINPTGEEPNKPTQIWTQGETESNSCWFPTIDSPNQKTSQEIYITVPNKFVTLSNGKLENQTQNNNGTRTDYWNFTQKHAPYLFFMAVGEFEIIKDNYKNIPVDYYVEKKYAPYAKEIFGDTPKMLGFFSKITGIEYPWNKYHQIICRDYVSGAMENTTAVIHGEHAHQTAGQLIDENTHESTIAHEIFHHWFGNLVTTESWSNLTVNESFANYSEYLWFEHKYGKDEADAHLLENIENYKNGENYDNHLVRFYYNDKEDMFDAVSYQKGGVILHMLRNFLGDEAFFKGLNTYLTDNKYSTGEAHQLRLAFEKVSGKDLNWFFNQWYFNSGHPTLEISYDYNELEKKVTVNINQTQLFKDFQFPFTIDIFEGNKPTRHNVFVNDRNASFTFNYKNKPDLIQVNADGVLLCNIEENKSLNEYIHQLKYAENYIHKKEALIKVLENQEDKNAFDAVVNTLNHNNFRLRKLALEKIDLSNKNSKKQVIEKIKNLATNDPKTLVQAAAIETLGKLTDPNFKSIFNKALQSPSYSVMGKALISLYYINKGEAVKISKEIPNEVKEIIATPLTRIYINENDDTQLEFIAKNVISGMFNTDTETQKLYTTAYKKIAKSDNTQAIKNLTNDIVKKGKQYKKYGFNNVGINMMRQMINIQKTENKPNKLKNIAIIEKAMEDLLK